MKYVTYALVVMLVSTAWYNSIRPAEQPLTQNTETISPTVNPNKQEFLDAIAIDYLQTAGIKTFIAFASFIIPYYLICSQRHPE